MWDVTEVEVGIVALKREDLAGLARYVLGA